MNKDLDSLTELAKSLTKEKLERLSVSGYVVPEKIKNRLSLEIRFEGDIRIFELVIAGKRPEDAEVLTSIKGNIRTIEFSEVTVSYDLLEKI